MQTRFLIATLVVLGLLGLAAVWQLNTGKADVKPVKPRKVVDANIDEPLEAMPLAGEPVDRPSLDDVPGTADAVNAKSVIAPPPPAPLVVNDPARGKLWLRLLDSRSNRPLENFDCALWRLPYNEGWYQREAVGRRSTDGRGLMSLSIGIVDHEVGDGYGEGYENAIWDVCLFYGSTDWLTYPVPTGWQPVTGLEDLSSRIEALGESDAGTPIDVLLSPSSTLRVTARDEWGSPLPQAELEIVVLEMNTSQENWFWMQDVELDSEYENNWREHCELVRRNRTRDSVICTLGVDEEPGEQPRILSESEWEAPRGSLFMKDLPALKIGALAWDPVYGFGEASVQLVPGSNELNVYLKPTNTCSVKLRIEWLDDEPAANLEPYLQLHSTGPFGRNSELEDSDDRIECDWDLKPSESGIWTGEIHNLPPGFWWLETDIGSRYEGSAHFQLVPFETRTITLYAGDKSSAHWTPIIQSGGVQLEVSSIRILGGDEEQPDEYSISHDSESGETESLELAAGTYTVWIPTLQPFELTLKPGETRSDVYELLSTSIRFTIDSDLAALLSPETSEVMLNLYPEDGWEEAEGHLLALDARLRKRDENYDILTPGITRNWMVPPAQYQWQLDGDLRSLEGFIEITATGPTSVNFGLNNLPGRALLEIDLIGFSEDNRPALEFDSDTLADTAVVAMRHYRWAEVTNDFSGYLEDGYYTQVLYSADGKRAYAYSAPGTRQMSVYAGSNEASFRVRFPGRMTVRPYDLDEKAEGELTFATCDPEDEQDYVVYGDVEYRIIAYHESGETDECEGDDTLELPFGKVTVMITRDDVEKTGTQRYSFATLEATINNQPQTVRLDKLQYKAFGQVSLTFKGHGSPDSPFDAWWYDDDGPTPPVVLALDQQVGGVPRYVHLEDPDRYMPGGELAFSYDNRLLPPGRYKVIPWRNAAEKWCVIFEVKPGASTSVIVEGGK